jgi:hypothetical protein
VGVLLGLSLVSGDLPGVVADEVVAEKYGKTGLAERPMLAARWGGGLSLVFTRGYVWLHSHTQKGPWREEERGRRTRWCCGG